VSGSSFLVAGARPADFSVRWRDIDAAGDLVMFDNEGREFDRARVADAGTDMNNGMAGRSLLYQRKRWNDSHLSEART
jgi:hypothetical protein